MDGGGGAAALEPYPQWCYTHETGEVFKGERSSFDDVLMNRATWYITDGVQPRLINCLARTVLLTPPERQTLKVSGYIWPVLVCIRMFHRPLPALQRDESIQATCTQKLPRVPGCLANKQMK